MAGFGRPLTSDVAVYFREGVYPFTNTVVFGVNDGDSNYTVTYQAYANETPVFSAGVVLTNWVDASGTPKPFSQKQGLHYHVLPGGMDRNYMLFDDEEFLPPALSDGHAPKYNGAVLCAFIHSVDPSEHMV